MVLRVPSEIPSTKERLQWKSYDAPSGPQTQPRGKTRHRPCSDVPRKRPPVPVISQQPLLQMGQLQASTGQSPCMGLSPGGHTLTKL